MDRIVKAAGGREAVAAVNGLKVRGKIFPLVDGPSSTLRIEIDLAGSLREETRDASGTRVRWLEGRLAWIGDKHAPPDVAGEIRYRFHELAAPLELARTPPDSLAQLEKTPEGWLRLARSFVGQRLAYDVDEKTGVLRRVSRLGQAPTSVSLELDDYRIVEGVAYPFRWTMSIGGSARHETILDRVTRIDDPRPQDFVPPNAGGGS